MKPEHALLRLLLCLKPVAYLVALVCTLVLSLSGFAPGWLGQRLHGGLLTAHMLCVPPFLLSIAFLFVTSAKAHDLVEAVTLRGLCFWLLVILAIPMTLTVILSMFPLVGTDAQRTLLGWHESVALLFVVTAILYSLLRVWSKRSVSVSEVPGRE